mgnify:FL=1
MNLENMTKIYARGDSRIQLKVIPGHFVTSQSHITHYLDLTTMKSRTAEAQNIAHELAANYEVSTPVDTIICMDGLEVIGAYLSEELTKAGIFSLNAHQTIYVITPESSNSGQIIFRDNFQPMIKGKNVLILNGSITTGSTLSKAIESILYYGGTIRGIAAIFSSVDSVALSLYILFLTPKIYRTIIPIHLQNVQCVRGSRKSMPLSAATDIQLCKSSKYFIKKLLPELMTLSGDR